MKGNGLWVGRRGIDAEMQRSGGSQGMRVFQRDGLMQVGEEGQRALTGPGREIANRLINRHHLIERMLTEVFGLEWYKVHDEAEQLEHAVSTDFEEKLVEKLGHGGVCPHGNIVGLDSPVSRRKRGLKPLDEARAGAAIRAASVI